MSGRDLAALTLGLMEGSDQNYLRARINQVAEFGHGFRRLGLPIQWPPGSNGIYLDGRSFLEGIVDQIYFPSQSICATIYEKYGIRPVEIGLSLAGRGLDGLKVIPDKDLVRFTVPRRVYTAEHFAFILEALEELFSQRDQIPGLVYEQEGLGNGHFTSRFRPVDRLEMKRSRREVLKYFGTPLKTFEQVYLPPNARRAYSFPPEV
jgi:tryptophanase